VRPEGAPLSPSEKTRGLDEPMRMRLKDGCEES
jgi:hypothetical protein